MAWTEVGGTTQTLTGSGTPDVLDTETGVGDYKFTVDLNTMVLGDAVTLEIAIKARAGATSRVVHREYFSGVQATKIYQSPVVTSISELIVTVTQTAGTGRSVIWSLEYERGALSAAEVTAAVPTAAAIAAVVAAPSAATIATAVVAKTNFTVVSGIAQGDGGANNKLQLAAGAVSSDDQFNIPKCIVAIVAGAGVGQQRGITATVNATDTITVDGDWTTPVDNTSRYIIFGN